MIDFRIHRVGDSVGVATRDLSGGQQALGRYVDEKEGEDTTIEIVNARPTDTFLMKYRIMELIRELSSVGFNRLSIASEAVSTPRVRNLAGYPIPRVV